MTARRWWTHPILLLGLVLLGLTLLAPMIGLPLSRVSEIAIYTLYGAGVNLLVGYTGLVPFGASVFFGCATYVVAITLLQGYGGELAALLAALAFSLVIGAALGLLILRRRGLYFSLLTLAASQIAFEVAYKWTAVTGGENGLQNVPLPLLGNPAVLHAFVVATVIGAMWLLWRLAHTPFGRVLQAVRDNEQRVACLGYDTFTIRLTAFAITAVLVGYGGGLLALLLRGAYADNLSWQHAGDALLMTVLGGIHQFLGPLWGAIAFLTLEDRLSSLTENWWLLFAPIVMLFALLSPEGLQGLAQRLTGRQRWTLVRPGIPPRPARIGKWQSAAAALDPHTPLLTLRGVSNRFGSLVTANDISLDVYPFRLHSLIGPNGAGKTTLFNILSGLRRPDGGEIRLAGTDVTRLKPSRRARLGISRSFQILSIFPTLTVFENVRIGVQAQSPMRTNLWRDAYALHDLNERTWSLLDAVGLADRAGDACADLPHGAKRLLEIGISLAGEAKLLLLDEPLAGLAEADRDIVGRLIRSLAETHAVLLIEHDIDRVLALSDRISVLHQGRLIADGKPDEVGQDPAVVAAYLGASRDSIAPAIERRELAAAKPVLELRGVCAGYGGSRILDRLDLVVHEGEAVALLGRNGVGKTTTLRAIMGVAQVDAGDILLDGGSIVGARPHVINQRGASLVPEGRRLFPNLTVAENLRLAARAGGASLDEAFALFPRLATLRRSQAESLSGGERQMVAIARALMVPSRVVLLDEPFEGLAPALVKEVLDALVKLRGRVSMVIVEHHAESVLPVVDRAYVLVNGRAAYEGSAQALQADTGLQARLLGIVQTEAIAAQ